MQMSPRLWVMNSGNAVMASWALWLMWIISAETLAHSLLTSLFDHRLRGSGSTVATMTSKVNGKTEILTPCRFETPENIEAKLGVNDYVMDPYNLANLCGNRSKGLCSPYWWNITYLWLCVPFLSFPFLPRDASAERGYEIAFVCPSVRLSVCPWRLGISNT